MTVMGKLLEALHKCSLIESVDDTVYAICGRTDKGVSAASQVVSIVLRSSLVSGYGIINDSGLRCSERSGLFY